MPAAPKPTQLCPRGVFRLRGEGGEVNLSNTITGIDVALGGESGSWEGFQDMCL